MPCRFGSAWFRRVAARRSKPTRCSRRSMLPGSFSVSIRRRERAFALPVYAGCRARHYRHWNLAEKRARRELRTARYRCARSLAAMARRKFIDDGISKTILLRLLKNITIIQNPFLSKKKKFSARAASVVSVFFLKTGKRQKL